MSIKSTLSKRNTFQQVLADKKENNMFRDDIYRLGLFNAQHITTHLHNKYANYIRDEYKRITGTDIQQQTIDSILSSVQLRLPEISANCDIEILVFDCLRKDILKKAKKDKNFLSTISPSVLENIDFNADCDNCELILECVLSLLSKKQSKYFLDRYYFLKDLKINNRYERLISKLFRGKGLASARFRYFGITGKKQSTIPYILWLDNLNFQNIEFMSDGTVAIISEKFLSYPIFYQIWERQYRRTKYTIPILLFLMIILVVFGLSQVL